MNFNFLYKKNIYVCVIDYMMLHAQEKLSFTLKKARLFLS